MPKVVDVAQRRQAIAGALWRVANREGVAAASVRVVAEEAGMSPGALRHYFSSQDDLLVFALEQMEATVREAVTSRQDSGDPLTDAMTVVGLLLPFDAASSDLVRAWFEVAVLARRRPAVFPVWERTHLAILDACAIAVRMLAPGLMGAALEREVDALHALADGLALHTVYDPEMTYERQFDTLRAHLTQLRDRHDP